MRYDVVLFDFDGTLVDSNEAVVSCFEKTLSFFCGNDHPISREHIHHEISKGTTLGDAFLALASRAVSADQLELNSMVDYYRSEYRSLALELTRCFPDVTSVLAELNAVGVRSVVLSNKGENAIRSILSHLHLERFFDLVIGERLGVPRKPDPSTFNTIIRRHYPNILMTKFFMVGDTSADIEFAQNSGIDICWAAYGYGEPNACRDQKPTHIIQHVSELRQVFKEHA